MFNVIKIKERLLLKIKKKFHLTGTGDSRDPIVINSLPTTNNIIKFKNIKSHIYVKDINPYEIKIIKSRNINITNCKIFRLNIEASHTITIQNNSIFYGSLRYCRESIFKNNILHRDYAAVKFSESGSKSGDLMMKKFQIGIAISSFLPILILTCALFSISIIIGLLSLFMYVLPLIGIINTSVKKNFIKGLSQNKFENNIYDTLDDLRPLFLKPKKNDRSSTNFKI